MKKPVAASTIPQNLYTPDINAQRRAESGQYWTPLGALNTAVNVGAKYSVMVFNSGGAVHYVKTGDGSVTAPTNAGNGIPIPAGATFILNMGPDSYIIADNAAVYGYKAVDNLRVRS